MNSKWLLLFILPLSFELCAQENPSITIIEFVEILDEQKAEAVYYYENNWKSLRVEALKREYISDFSLFEIPYSQELPAHLVLLTEFKDQEQYDAVEENFKILFEERGERKLLNEKQPGEFRKTVISKVSVRSY